MLPFFFERDSVVQFYHTEPVFAAALSFRGANDEFRLGTVSGEHLFSTV